MRVSALILYSVLLTVASGCGDGSNQKPTAVDIVVEGSASRTFTPAVHGLPAPPEEVLAAQAGLTLPAGFLRTKDRRIYCEVDAAEMVLVPSGEFLMGNDGEKFAVFWSTSDGPQHRVVLGAYLVDRHPVTLGQWRKFTATVASSVVPSSVAGGLEDAFLPASALTFEDAHRYAAWAGKTLPTEAQWEKAARGQDGRFFPWGDEERRLPENVVPVGRLPENASPYGVLWMAGGATEWCIDLCGPSQADARMFDPYPPDPLVIEPSGASQGVWRIVRNGFFENSLTKPKGIFVENVINLTLYTSTTHWRRPMDSSNRNWSPEDARNALRCVLRLEQ
jgi:formylglycine-generating enzyme required for sulfatase activity